MIAPARFQLSRRAGYRMPPGGASVTRGSRWGNPHKVADVGRAEAVKLFEEDLLAGRLPISVDDVRRHLAGRPLGCTCRLDEACHADVLLRVANPAALGVGVLGVALSASPVRSAGAAVASLDMRAGLTAQERRHTEPVGSAGYGAGRSASGSAAADISGIGTKAE